MLVCCTGCAIRIIKLHTMNWVFGQPALPIYQPYIPLGMRHSQFDMHLELL